MEGYIGNKGNVCYFLNQYLLSTSNTATMIHLIDCLDKSHRINSNKLPMGSLYNSKLFRGGLIEGGGSRLN